MPVLCEVIFIFNRKIPQWTKPGGSLCRTPQNVVFYVILSRNEKQQKTHTHTHLFRSLRSGKISSGTNASAKINCTLIHARQSNTRCQLISFPNLSTIFLPFSPFKHRLLFFRPSRTLLLFHTTSRIAWFCTGSSFAQGNSFLQNRKSIFRILN